MLTLLFLKPGWATSLILRIAQGTATDDDIAQITNPNVLALLQRYGKRLGSFQIDDDDLAMYIDNNPLGIEVKEFPLLIHCDARNNKHLYYLSTLLTDDFMVASMIEDDMRVRR